MSGAGGSSANNTRRVELLLEQMDALPTLSPVAVRLLSLGADDETDVDEVVTLIESDPSLTARILQMCRAGDTGMSSERVQTVRKAVLLIGLEAVQAAVLSVSVFELMQEEGHRVDQSHASRRVDTRHNTEGVLFDRVGFWRHSVSVACASELIARQQPGLGVRPDEAFVGGLLHDLGKLVLDLVLPESYIKVLRVAETKGVDSRAVERGLIGLDHHTAGKRLAERWGLPQQFRDVIWLHGHRAASVPDVPHKAQVGIVTVARTVCRSLHLGWCGDFGKLADPAEQCGSFGIDASACEQIQSKLHQAAAERCAALGLEQRTSRGMRLQSMVSANKRLASLGRDLETRTRVVRHRGAVIDLVRSFCEGGRVGEPTSATMARVGASASQLLGAKTVVSACRSPGGGWRVDQIDLESGRTQPLVVGSPGGAFDRLRVGQESTVSGLGISRWASPFVASAREIGSMRVLCLLEGGASEVGPGVLIHDGKAGAGVLDEREFRALVSVWSSAVLAAIERGGIERLSEQLADASRAVEEMQAVVTEQESMARLGEMTAGAAHEMNNPLTVIRGRAQLLLDERETESVRSAARAIDEASADLSDLISSLHLLASPPELHVAKTTLGDVVTCAIELVGERAHRVLCDVANPGRVVFVDKEVVARGVLELIANALDASDETSIVGVRAGIDPDDDRLVIAVSDEGPGLSERARRHAFDPFFSEKRAGRQRGLGLPRAKRLVEQLDGRIELTSGGTGGVVATLSIGSWRDEGAEPRALGDAA